MRLYLLVSALLCAAGFAIAQSPGDDFLQGAQRKAGAAFSELQKTEFEMKRAEQEYREADASHKAAQKRAGELKAQSDAAQKKLESAKAREAVARRIYDAAVEAVDKIPGPAPRK